MTEKESAENPNSPAGWAVQDEVNPDTYPGGELLALEEKKREDTAAWIDQNNPPFEDGVNPAQPGGYEYAPAQRSAGKDDCGSCPAGTKCVCTGDGCTCKKTSSIDVVARVFASRTAGKITGSKVLLGTSEDDHQLGQVVAVSDDKFWVSWRDGEDSVEKMADYELIVREDGE